MDPSIEETARALTTAVAPVFLISSIGVLMASMIARYGRVIDRIRTLLREGDRLYNKARTTDHVKEELRSLYKRARLLRTTIILTVLSILFVVFTVLCVFGSLIFRRTIGYAAEINFLMSLMLLMASLGLYLEDFVISLRTIKDDIYVRADEDVLQESPPAT